ncbi:MAG: hypothetical protein GY710_26390 [Desulfobacteraceae bacterium]|nr:hypothetical protein [Desulfobacteraceae bacterium]
MEYDYDELGQTSAVTINGEKTINIHRDKTGLPIKETFTGPLIREYDYNKDSLLTKQKIGTPGRDIVQRDYAYDPVGNLVEKSDSLKGKNYFSYDPMGRITQHINPENKIEKFLRDPAGDLIKQQDPEPELQADMEADSDPKIFTRTSECKDSLYTFNAAGNLIERKNKDDLTAFSWDENNRLIQAHRNGTITKMRYDAAGRRITKETNEEITEFFWDGDAFLGDKKGKDKREFIYYPGTFEPLAVVDKDKKIFYFNNDLAGLPQEVTTDTGEIAWSASYDAHGQVTKIHEDYFDNPLRLQGQYFDPEIDLCYNRHRYYDPASASFVSADPLGLGAGTNNYAYAPNVWGWIDPLGLMCEATLKKEAGFGESTTTNYKKTFFKEHPNLEGNVVVHHAVEQQTLKRYPGVVSKSEIHSLENLRGIPKNINSEVHLSKIRKAWNRFYKQNSSPMKQQLLDKATEIDTKFGSQFKPKI